MSSIAIELRPSSGGEKILPAARAAQPLNHGRFADSEVFASPTSTKYVVAADAADTIAHRVRFDALVKKAATPKR